MKFTNGYWLVRDDCSLYQAAGVGDVLADDRSVTLFAPARAGNGRKNLGGITLTVTFFSPAEDIIGVKAYHHKGDLRKHPSFAQENHAAGHVERDEKEIRLISGKTRVVIRTGDDWDVSYWYEGTRLTGSGWRSLGYAVMDDGQAYVKEELGLSVGESVYGLGERFTPFIKNGQVVDIWNLDGGTGSEQAYKNIPLYVTNRGYGIFVNDPGRVSFEIASEKVERVQFSTKGESLEYYVLGGGSIKAALQGYCRMTGFPALPPAWSFGLWLTTSFTTDYDEATVNSFIDGMAERDIPLQVFHFDCFWMKGSHWCNFEWDRDAFPDPEGMLRRLKAKGLKICVWINPYIAQRSRLFDEGLQNGYFIMRTDGTVYQTDDWQPGMAIVDFTNPDACRWYQDALKTLLDMGVDTFKTDFGERIPTENIRYFSGDDPERMHNYYTYLYNKTVFDLLEKEMGKGNALVFARSATAGGQQFPVHWSGDCVASYESMAESLRGGLSLTSCGFGFWSHDMGGFENFATPDLYKRWCAFGMLSTHSRLHGNSSYRVPWLFDEEAVDVLRFFTKLKLSLMPYLFAQAVKTHQSGIPMMRPMVMEFEGDPVAGFLERQYMLGDSLMVAPVFSETGDVEYYVPEGTWTGLIDGKTRRGGWHRENHGYMSVPVLVRENTLLATGSYAAPEISVFGLSDSAECTIYEEGTLTPKHFTASRKDGVITVSGEGAYTLSLRGIASVQSVAGGLVDSAPVEGFRIQIPAGAGTVTITL